MYPEQEADDFDNRIQWEYLREWPRAEGYQPLPVTGLSAQFDYFEEDPFNQLSPSYFDVTLDEQAITWPHILVSFPPSQLLPFLANEFPCLQL
jgi:hypothetical protein